MVDWHKLTNPRSTPGEACEPVQVNSSSKQLCCTKTRVRDRISRDLLFPLGNRLYQSSFGGTDTKICVYSTNNHRESLCIHDSSIENASVNEFLGKKMSHAHQTWMFNTSKWTLPFKRGVSGTTKAKDMPPTRQNLRTAFAPPWGYMETVRRGLFPDSQLPRVPFLLKLPGTTPAFPWFPSSLSPVRSHSSHQVLLGAHCP